MTSGGGTSIQSTCPVRSAASRVVGSGVGNKITLLALGTRCLSQYSGNGSSSARRAGPVGELEGAGANRMISEGLPTRPPFSHGSGLP